MCRLDSRLVKVTRTHRWNVAPRQAIALQQRLRAEVVPQLRRPLPPDALVAGADISYDKGSDKLFAGVVLLQLPELRPVEHTTIIERARFPYVPGLLSFREAPALLKVFRKLRRVPDVILIDGQGLAHPRRFGIACHLGLLLGVPTIGCAKSILCGGYEKLGLRRGAASPLVHKGETVGVALRTRRGVQPVFISVGSHIDLPNAVAMALRCSGKYRIPEPTRQAHILVNQLRRAA